MPPSYQIAELRDVVNRERLLFGDVLEDGRSDSGNGLRDRESSRHPRVGSHRRFGRRRARALSDMSTELGYRGSHVVRISPRLLAYRKHG